MITKIEIKNVASYKGDKVIITPTKINFFYGSNGSGKTTISRIISAPNRYPSCNLEWKGNRPLRTVVYNEDFVKRYFYQSENLPGIFTMNEGASEIEEEINEIKENIDKLRKDREKYENTLQKKQGELEKKSERFEENCWNNIYLKHKKDFKEIFKGYMKSKKKFADKVINEIKNNKSQLKSYEELKRKYDLLYREKLLPLSKIEFSLNDFQKQLEFVENHKILQTKIIGKQDVDIAKMIQKLQNYDWVKQGVVYYEKNYDEETGTYICPFCQQHTTLNFKKQLEEYFDETYENQMKQLESVYETYKEITQRLIETLRDIIKLSDNKYLEARKGNLKDKTYLLEKVIKGNCDKFETKLTNPSIPIELDSLKPHLSEISAIIKEINAEVESHNKVVENKEAEKQQLISEIWGFFIDMIGSLYQEYQRDINDIEKAINNLETKIKENKQKEKDLRERIQELEKKIKSVKPTVDGINQLLTNFGFTGFKLKPTDDDKHYQIVREDGSLAKETLSEGERNFIVFLYFYHLISGAFDPSEIINDDKIVVIDDPVSSLDSNVLFIVSTLIKDFLRKVRKNEGNIKQIFILTHNAYFFREVTYISSRDSSNIRNDTLYFIVRKLNGITSVTHSSENPIRTTYQLLWDELKKNENDAITLQNTMRRILEFYFKILGNLDKFDEELINEFDDIQDKMICRSLIAWINVGSHAEAVFEDQNYVSQPEEIERYKKVFKRIFEVTKQIEHYNMMMDEK